MVFVDLLWVFVVCVVWVGLLVVYWLFVGLSFLLFYLVLRVVVWWDWVVLLVGLYFWCFVGLLLCG